MARHSYRITINRIPAAREPIEYTYRAVGCTLTCSKDAASVRFEMGTLRSFEDLISFRVDLIKDAMRKMYLLHALRQDSRLRVRRILVEIDGDTRVYEPGFPGFPFLHSMLTARELGLPKSWHDREFLTAVLSATKTKSDRDPRYACLFSFLAGAGRVYESEKFTCYWTAVNACYNHLLECAKPLHARRNGKAAYSELPRKRQTLSGDAVGIGAMLRLLECGRSLAPQSDRTAHKSQYGAVRSYLAAIPREAYPSFYQQLLEHRTDHDWFPDGPLGDHLRLCCARTGSTAWGFLVLDYAYYIRCNYLHGSKTTILFTAEGDPELAAFRALNVFLGELLKELIPAIFREDWFTEQTFRRVFPWDL